MTENKHEIKTKKKKTPRVLLGAELAIAATLATGAIITAYLVSNNQNKLEINKQKITSNSASFILKNYKNYENTEFTARIFPENNPKAFLEKKYIINKNNETISWGEKRNEAPLESSTDYEFQIIFKNKPILSHKFKTLNNITELNKKAIEQERTNKLLKEAQKIKEDLERKLLDSLTKNQELKKQNENLKKDKDSPKTNPSIDSKKLSATIKELQMAIIELKQADHNQKNATEKSYEANQNLVQKQNEISLINKELEEAKNKKELINNQKQNADKI
ncbi:hypothetical protein [Mycoplasma sp. 327]